MRNYALANGSSNAKFFRFGRIVVISYYFIRTINIFACASCFIQKVARSKDSRFVTPDSKLLFVRLNSIVYNINDKTKYISWAKQLNNTYIDILIYRVIA